ncbi:MAG: hypothetical protein DRP86_00590 [Candidatus Neomarinimicrobiota bacterium]|nr:MAG: hypothetical protein DRP86_00590 [Candidatus Neomarinimicrobiota bacterium]
MMTQLKICGFTSRADAFLAVEHGISILGFIFYPESPRYISPDKAADMIRYLPFYVSPVGIVVRPTAKELVMLQKRTGCRVMQVYEPKDFEIFHSFPFPVIWAFRGVENVKKAMIQDLKPPDMILIDTFSKKTYGGTGKSFAWETIPGSIPREALILAGGITRDTIRDALEEVHPAIIDIAGGSESVPGKKDFQKIRALITSVHAFNMEQLRKKETEKKAEIIYDIQS